jgi:hypothetical protein
MQVTVEKWAWFTIKVAVLISDAQESLLIPLWEKGKMILSLEKRFVGFSNGVHKALP